MQEKPKNRDWVKNAAIIFLAVLLVLTFFSNTIMNRSLPEVATQEVTNGSIVARVRGTGTVTANSNTQVKMEKTRVIRSVLVKVGQQVEAGDVLFTLGEGSSEEIEAAETALRNLQASYNRTAASMPYHNYTTEERKLKLLEEQLKEAKENLDIAEEAAKAATPYAKQLEDIEKELNNAIIARDAAKEEYDKARGTGESVVAISIEEFVNYDRKIDGEFDMTFVLLGNHLNDNLSVQELNNFQAAILRILALEEKIDGDLLTGDYTDRGRIDIQIDRVQSLIDGTSYSVKFYNDDGTLLQASEESYGAVPYYKYGEPTKNDDDQYTYTFLKWDPTIKEVEEDIEYVAVFQSHLKQTEAEESPEPSSTPDQTVIINTENVNINVTTPSPSPSPDSSPDASSSLEASSSPSAQLSSSLNLSMSPSQSTELTNDNAENAEYVETPSVPASDNSAGAELQASSVTTSISRDTDETNIEASNTEENADKTETEIKSPVTGEKSRAELLPKVFVML